MNIRMHLLAALCLTATLSYGPAGSVAAATTNLDEAIRQIRLGTLVIEAAPGAEIQVEQLRHEFWFGAALANQMFRNGPYSEEAARYKKDLPGELQRGRDGERPQVAQQGAAKG